MESNDMWYWVRPAGACVRVTGDDAFEYLQSQMSQDLRPLEKGGVAYGLWLDKKGKVRADSFVLRDGDGYYLVAHGFSGEELIECASVNVIADDVEFSVDPDAQVWLTVFGAGAVAAVAKLIAAGDTASVDLARVAPIDGVTAVVPGLVEGSLHVIIKRDQQASVLEALCDAGCREDDDGSAYRRTRVAAGILEVPSEVAPVDLPQEVGLERWAVSYTKGCYFGQEVMARLRAMGRPRNGLAKVRMEVGVGETLPVDLELDDVRVGEIRVVAGHMGLAVVSHRRVPQAEAVVCRTPDKTKVVIDGWLA